MNKYLAAFCILIILLVSVLWKYHEDVRDIRRLPMKTMQELDLDTGDVIFVRRDYVTLIEPWHYCMFNILPYMFGGSVATHSGVIVKVDGRPLLYQTTIQPAYDVLTRKFHWLTPVLVDPREYCLGYPGEIMVYKRKREFAITDPHLPHILKNYDRRMTMNVVRVSNVILQLPVQADDRYCYCVQLTAEYLRDIKALELTKEPHRLDFADLENDILTSNCYEPPVIMFNAYTNYVINGELATELS